MDFWDKADKVTTFAGVAVVFTLGVCFVALMIAVTGWLIAAILS